MTDLELDPAVIKLLEYAKEKKILSLDEMNDLLPDTIINTDKMDQVLVLL
ncbi:MAG TPA: RNA polymerase sigma factor region1.1 domain-containing protein, partial [Treponemataceae bacterium]|nr:RNA polymerase sigma factor region1.1 domain-containing protein [Treponemataceae bacterium]